MMFTSRNSWECVWLVALKRFDKLFVVWGICVWFVEFSCCWRRVAAWQALAGHVIIRRVHHQFSKYTQTTWRQMTITHREFILLHALCLPSWRRRRRSWSGVYFRGRFLRSPRGPFCSSVIDSISINIIIIIGNSLLYVFLRTEIVQPIRGYTYKMMTKRRRRDAKATWHVFA